MRNYKLIKRNAYGAVYAAASGLVAVLFANGIYATFANVTDAIAAIS